MHDDPTPDGWQVWVGALLGPVPLILVWYALARILDLPDSDSVWALATVTVVAGAAAVVWIGERYQTARVWTALAVAGYAAATCFWAVVMFLIALEISCRGAESCFN